MTDADKNTVAIFIGFKGMKYGRRGSAGPACSGVIDAKPRCAVVAGNLAGKQHLRLVNWLLDGFPGPSGSRRKSRNVNDAIRSPARERREVYVGTFSLSSRSGLQPEIVGFRICGDLH